MFQLLFFLIPLLYSKKLLDPESRYSAFDRELFVAYSSLLHVKEGRQFILFTDQKPLTFALFRTSLLWSAMQQRRLSFLSEFNCEISHLPGPENVVADALSHPEPSNVPQHPSSTTLISELQPTSPQPVLGICFYKSSAKRLNFSAFHQPYLLFLFRTQVRIF